MENKKLKTSKYHMLEDMIKKMQEEIDGLKYQLLIEKYRRLGKNLYRTSSYNTNKNYHKK